MTLDHIERDQALARFDITDSQVEGAPDADLTLLLSPRWEAAYAGHYSIPSYWGGSGLWGEWETVHEARVAAHANVPATPPSVEDQRLRNTARSPATTSTLPTA
jgi:hypothetical protein